MGQKMLIDAAHPEETRVVVVQGNRIEEFDFESAAKKQLRGSIYLAKVTRVEPSLQAAFVDYGGNRHGFLAFSEIHPDYYQIPVADREALLKEQEEEQKRLEAELDAEDEDGGNRRDRRSNNGNRDRGGRGRGRRGGGRRGGRRSRWPRSDRRGKGSRDPLTIDAAVGEPGSEDAFGSAPSDDMFGPFLPGSARLDLEAAEEGSQPFVSAEWHSGVSSFSYEGTESPKYPLGHSGEAEEGKAGDNSGWASPQDAANPAWTSELGASGDAASSRPLLGPSIPTIAVPLPETKPAEEAKAPDADETDANAETSEDQASEDVTAEAADATETTAAVEDDNAEAVEAAQDADEDSATADDASSEENDDTSEEIVEARGTDAEDESTSDDDSSDSDEDAVEARSTEESDDDASDEDSDEEGDDDTEELSGDSAEEEAEEVRERRPRRSRLRQYKIQEVIKRRQIMLVQVVKEERGNKGAALTTYLSLAGRYCVLMPNTARGGGISRKITQMDDRRRLKEVAQGLDVPQGMGLIVRTAGAQRTKSEIKRDYEYLLRLWENVRDLTLRSTAPTLVYEEGSLIKRSIRDLYSREIDAVLVEGEDGYKEAKAFMKMLMPSHARNVQPYRDRIPLFQRYQVETMLDSMFSPQVQLPSGGYLVIHSTEALVAIDVNSGRATREHSIEETAYKTNLEAAEEVARQLRLRDLAGLIVIDFIDMEDLPNNRKVERRLKECLKNDRARIQVGRISNFGLLEMSRQRLRAGVLEGSTLSCPHCEGSGKIRSVESAALRVLRACEEEGLRERCADVTVRVPPDVAIYILNHKRQQLMDILNRYGLQVIVAADASLYASDLTMERGEPLSAERKAQIQGAAINMETAYQTDLDDEDEDDIPVAEDSSEEETTSQDTEESRSDEESEDGKDRSRRRRGRRGGRRRRDNRGEDQSEEQESDEIAARSTEDSADGASEGDQNTDDDASASGDDEDEDGKPRRRRRRGRRGGRRRKGDDETSADADGAAQSDPSQADQPPMASWELAVAPQETPKKTADTPDAAPVKEEPVANGAAPARQDTAAQAEEAEDGDTEVLTREAPAVEEDSGPKRKGWWQRRFF